MSCNQIFPNWSYLCIYIDIKMWKSTKCSIELIVLTPKSIIYDLNREGLMPGVNLAWFPGLQDAVIWYIKLWFKNFPAIPFRLMHKYWIAPVLCVKNSLTLSALIKTLEEIMQHVQLIFEFICQHSKTEFLRAKTFS